MKPRRMEWVGIGWIDCGEPQGDETIVETAKRVRRVKP